jgi:hypothetical protein
MRGKEGLSGARRSYLGLGGARRSFKITKISLFLQERARKKSKISAKKTKKPD